VDPVEDLARMKPRMAAGFDGGFELVQLHRAEIGSRIGR
jgi:hypothetical protein